MQLHRSTTLAMVLLTVVALPVGLRPTGGIGHTYSGFSAEAVAVIDWGTELFAEAGLPLPGVDFNHHPSKAGCHGRPGWHVRRGARSLIDICIPRSDVVLKFLILHELAHAWDSHYLSGRERAAFLEVRQLTDWWGTDPDRWHEYGAEQAAEVVVWALMDHPIRSRHIPAPYNECQHLIAGYDALTGRPPLHGYTTHCRDGG